MLLLILLPAFREECFPCTPKYGMEELMLSRCRLKKKRREFSQGAIPGVRSHTYIDNGENSIIVSGGNVENDLQLGDQHLESSSCCESANQRVCQVPHYESDLQTSKYQLVWEGKKKLMFAWQKDQLSWTINEFNLTSVKTLVGLLITQKYLS